MFPVQTIGKPPSPDTGIVVRDNKGDTLSWRVPEETPTAFIYNRRNYAVMLATPLDLVDYAVGFSLTEKVIDDVADIVDLTIAYSDQGVDLRLRISDECLARLDLVQRRRNMPGNAGCGVCGVENADTFFTPLARVSESPVSLDKKAVEKAFAQFLGKQPLNSLTRSVHGAAWVTVDGDIKCVKEDVGRHNALDKLLGSLAISETDTKIGFVLMSSRCSYELIEKAARRGVRALASISAPTNFAMRKAAEANLALYARGPDGAVELILDPS